MFNEIEITLMSPNLAYWSVSRTINRALTRNKRYPFPATPREGVKIYTWGSNSMNIKRIAAVVGAAVFSLTVNISAEAVTFSVHTSAGQIPGVLDDFQGPANTGLLSSTSTDNGGSGLDFSGVATSRAVGNSDGLASVSAEGVYACGSCVFELTADSLFETSFTNTSANAVNFTYDFFINGPSVELVDFANIDESAGLRMFTEANVTMITSGGVSDSFAASLELTGGDSSHTVNSVGGFASFFTTPSGFGYNMADLTGIFTGSLAAGESVTFETSLLASVNGPGFEVGGRATIGDPNNLTITPGASSTFSVSAVPVPAAIWLFGSGMLGLVGFARRR